MISKKNKNLSIRKKIKNSTPVIGTWLQIPHVDVARIVSNYSYDYIAIDLEHGSGSIHDVPLLSSIINNSSSAFFARISEENFSSVHRLLDLGIEGFICSKIENSEILENLISKSYYPPDGDRGYGFSISNNFGIDDMKKTITFKPIIVAQIETERGYENIENILNVKGLDCILVGPYDLSLSLGVPGKFKSKKYISCLKKITNVCKNNKKACGIHIVDPNENELKNYIKKGFKFFGYSMDTSAIKIGLKKPKIFK